MDDEARIERIERRLNAVVKAVRLLLKGHQVSDSKSFTLYEEDGVTVYMKIEMTSDDKGAVWTISPLDKDLI